MQTSGAWCGKLPRVDVGNFPDGSVDVLQVFSLHHQDGLSRVEVELQEGEERGKQWVVTMMNIGWQLVQPVNSDIKLPDWRTL